jgi:hypothetical protein
LYVVEQFPNKNWSLFSDPLVYRLQEDIMRDKKVSPVTTAAAFTGIAALTFLVIAAA